MDSPSSSYTGRSRRNSPVKYIRGQAGIYNSSNRMTKQQWAWAEDGIQQSNYSVSCKEGRYFTFKLNAYPTQDGYALGQFEAKVSIGPEGSKYDVPKCTCRDYIEAQRACRHIFYILDKVLSYEDQDLEDIEGTMPLRFDGHCLPSPTGPYYQLKSRGLVNIAQAHRWAFSGPGEWSISDQTKDMLRHMDQSTDYATSHYSDEYLSTSPSLAGTVYRLAISKPEFFANLRQEAPVDPCSKSYFKLVDQQIDYAFRRWINYTKTGCPRLSYRDDDTHPDNLGTPNVPWVAGRLEKLAYDIELAIAERRGMSYDNYCRAFRLLLKMLESVIDMDLDALELDYRPRVEMAGGTGMERNLFTRLIGHHYPDRSNFVISIMRRMPHAGQPFLQRLLDCRQVIHEKASREFTEEFEILLREIQN
ncbi:hypothetical protein TWF506_001630 [Arthrobotrys conoides]|uniref:SWIM-type domain-containing protein n=1 Tax=Arthrobotrys conoides TaxID=74498 RepID=A0AAN8PS40_9PEZI